MSRKVCFEAGYKQAKKELKAKVVKWVKEEEELRRDNTIWRLNGDELLDIIQERWMKRLDITEEDLK